MGIEALIEQIASSKLSNIYEDKLWGKILNWKLDDEDLERIVCLYVGTRIIFPLRQPIIVKKFGSLCCDLLVQNLDNVAIVLNIDDNGAKLPKEFSDKLRDAFFSAYVQSDNPNPNYLEKIAFDKHTSSEVRLSSKKRFQAENDKLLKSATAITREMSVSIDASIHGDEDIVADHSTLDGIYKASIHYNYNSLKSLCRAARYSGGQYSK